MGFYLFYLFIGDACLKPGKIYKKDKPHPQANKAKWKIIKKGENLVTEKWKSNSFSYLIWFAFTARDENSFRIWFDACGANFAIWSAIFFFYQFQSPALHWFIFVWPTAVFEYLPRLGKSSIK